MLRLPFERIRMLVAHFFPLSSTDMSNSTSSPFRIEGARNGDRDRAADSTLPDEQRTLLVRKKSPSRFVKSSSTTLIYPNCRASTNAVTIPTVKPEVENDSALKLLRSVTVTFTKDTAPVLLD